MPAIAPCGLDIHRFTAAFPIGYTRRNVAMLLDPTTRGPVLRQHEKPHDHGRIPAEAFARDPRRKADLRVVATKRLLDRRDLGLELDHQERA